MPDWITIDFGEGAVRTVATDAIASVHVEKRKKNEHAPVRAALVIELQGGGSLVKEYDTYAEADAVQKRLLDSIKPTIKAAF